MYLWCSLALGAATLQPVQDGDLCITSGQLQVAENHMLTVRDQRLRAVVRYMTPAVAELRFVYSGPTPSAHAFSSGIVRQQIGLKLRAADPCNLLYVMWRISPSPNVVVSLKSNPQRHRSNTCGGAGYKNVKPALSTTPPILQRGRVHRLYAELIGRELTVRADNVLVWQGTLGDEAEQLRGPVGVRADNGRFSFKLYTAAMLSQSVPVMDESRCHAVGEIAAEPMDRRDLP